MARQLQALGERVERLVLFDSPVPGEPPPGARMQWYEFLRNVRRYGIDQMKPFAKWRARELAKHYLPFLTGRAGRSEELANAARQIGALDVEDSGFVDLYYYFSAAADRYQMTSLDVDAVLVKADRIWPVHPHDYHWGRYITGQIDVITAPGDHWAMFYPENVPHLAQALMPLIEPR
jgi:thioesterase domain-containing protein